MVKLCARDGDWTELWINVFLVYVMILLRRAAMNEKIGSGRDENRVPLYKVVPMKIPFSISIGTSDFCNFRCNDQRCWWI